MSLNFLTCLGEAAREAVWPGSQEEPHRQGTQLLPQALRPGT